jgi:thiosulfate reductase cytochrome b subunit
VRPWRDHTTPHDSGPLLSAALSCATLRALGMAESAYVAGLVIQNPEVLDSPRHSALVRITHWIHTLSFFALIVSGIGILLAHPRFYWGETGAVGTPSLFDLPLPFLVTTSTYVGPSSWGRSLHFLAAWICVLNGLLYAISGLLSQHFRKNLLPTEGQLSVTSVSRIVSNHLRMKRPSEEESLRYNFFQRLAYFTVVFLLFPLMIWTGLAMSPSITSVFPILVTALHGQQSARTIHFFVANFLVLFLLVHIAMVCLAGFTKRVRAMITGRSAARTEPS